MSEDKKRVLLKIGLAILSFFWGITLWVPMSINHFPIQVLLSPYYSFLHFLSFGIEIQITKIRND